jgi:hypothetical protein
MGQHSPLVARSVLKHLLEIPVWLINFLVLSKKMQDDPEYYASMVSGDDIPDKEMRDEIDNFVGNVAYEVMEAEARGEDFEPPSELGEDECASP